MSRGSYPRATSPTNTAYSGFSTYRNDSYRSTKPPAMPTLDPRVVAKIHYDELNRYLYTYLAKEPANSRSGARQKLTRLTRQQFQELSTDVYDELVRRKNNSSENEVPFLPVRDDFHPKRNQARQKLATLPSPRFKDLSSDVYYELLRRYPEFKEDVPESPALTSPGSTYDDVPSPDFPSPVSKGPSLRAPDSGYAGSSSSWRGNDDGSSVRRRAGDDTYRRKGGDEDDSHAGSSTRRRPSQDAVNLRAEDRRRPSAEEPRRSSERERERDRDRDRDRDLNRRPSAAASSVSDSNSNPQSSTATSAMIVPNKSTIAEEEIEVPFGRDPRDSSGTAVDESDRHRDASVERNRDRERERERDFDTDGAMTDGEPDTAGGFRSPRSPQAGFGLGLGLSALSARLKGAVGGSAPPADAEEEDEGALSGAGGRSGEEYYDKMSLGRASVASDRSRGTNGRMSVAGEEQERIRREYEYKIATMQSRMAGLERDLEGMEERERKWAQGEASVKRMENELAELRERAEAQSSTIRALQRELEELREDRARDKEREKRRAQEDEDELRILRERCEGLEAERMNSLGGANAEEVEQLRADMEGLLTELSDLSARNDELMTAKDSDIVVIRDLDIQLKEYKRKYEQAKTELRSVKATSQLFLQPPKSDDQLPVSADGGLLDIHVTAFLTGIDSLLTAGRSNAPTRVLTPMKAVVNAVSAIVEDVRLYERRPRRDRSEVDVDALRALRERADATLSNLVAASKTHAQSAGMSPVSLLDAAASHVSATVTEIGKTILVRKATRAEQEQFSVPVQPSSATATNGFVPSLRSVDEVKGGYQRTGSSSSPRDFASPTARYPESTMSPTRLTSGRSSGEERRRPPSEPSSSNTSSPAPIFDQLPSGAGAGIASDDSAVTEGPEDAWAELKPYLEAQSETIVYAIQSVLSAVRSPTPSPNLNENLTQIITIVSSIVAVCNDSLPPNSAQQGNEILRELSDHADRLSEVQALPEVTKDARQVMAKSSFAVANAMKGLMKL